MEGQGQFDVKGQLKGLKVVRPQKFTKERGRHVGTAKANMTGQPSLPQRLFFSFGIGARSRRDICALDIYLWKSMDSMVMFPCHAHGVFAVMLKDIFMAFSELGLPLIRPRMNKFHVLKSNSRRVMLGRFACWWFQTCLISPVLTNGWLVDP